jgi:hypothetical protein
VIPLFIITPPIVFGVLFGLMLFGAPTLNAIVGAYSIALVPDRLMGRVESAANVLTAGANPISRLTAGLLLSAFSGNTAIIIWAGAAFLVALAAWSSRAIRDVPQLESVSGRT